MSLFDPAPFEVESDDPSLSYTQRLTIRNRRTIEAGTHPATLRPLLGNGATCETCVHHQDRSWRSKKHLHKCDEHHLGVTHSEASDIRVSWPACVLYEERSGV